MSQSDCADKIKQRGGKRLGAGRPTIDPNGNHRSRCYLSMTREELRLVREYLKQLRSGLEADSSDYYD